MSDKQAYAGQADPSSGMSEYNRLEFMVRMQLNRVVTMTVVEVMAVDKSAQTVDIRPLVGQTDGAGNITPHGTIHNVPYATQQGGANAVIITPVVGDIGKASFAHNDISTVKTTKKQGPPGSLRKFDWADAVYEGALFNASAATQTIVIDDDGITITSEGEVNIIAPDGVTVDGDLAVTEKFGVNGATPQAKATLVAALAPTATNAQIVALLNPIRALLIANGQAQ